MTSQRETAEKLRKASKLEIYSGNFSVFLRRFTTIFQAKSAPLPPLHRVKTMNDAFIGLAKK